MVSSIDLIASDFSEPEADYSCRTATRFAALQRALDNCDISFDLTSEKMRIAVPALATVETAEIERIMRSIVVGEIQHHAHTAVAFDQRRRIVFTLDVPKEEKPRRALKTVSDAVQAACLTGDKSEAEVEIYLMPRGTYGLNPMLVHIRGIPFGTIKLSSRGKVSAKLGIERDIEIAYRPEQKPMLSERVYLSDAKLWSMREMSRQLDWLAAHLCWVRDFQTSTVSRQLHYASGTSDIETQEPAKQQLVDEISVRIFVLAVKLVDCDPSLLSENEVSAARRCASLDPAHLPFLTESIVARWKEYIAAVSEITAIQHFSKLPIGLPVNDAIEPDMPTEQHAEIEEIFSRTSDAQISGVAFNGAGQAIVTRLFAAEEARDVMLAKMVEAMKPNLEPMPQRYNASYFEVYVTDGGVTDIESARESGSALGFIEYDPASEQVTAEQVAAFGPDHGYPLQEDVFLGESLDVTDVDAWSSRKILRCLDRLMEEHYFIDAHGLMAPFDGFGHDMSRSHNTMVRTQLQRHARVSDRIFTRIFALCATLMNRNQLNLVSDFEFDFATNCTDIGPEDHPGIPAWLSLQWDSLLARLQNERLT